MDKKYRLMLEHQPSPVINPNRRPVYHTAIELIEARAELGRERYHNDLTANNGRDCFADLIQEIADAMTYGAQMFEEELERREKVLQLKCWIAHLDSMDFAQLSELLDRLEEIWPTPEDVA